MKILITNDDGIQAAALPALVAWAKKYGEVTVICPKVEQSGKSHGIEIHKGFALEEVDMGEGVTAFSLDSTPADCVRYAILGRKEQFDLVISGINRGLNLGADIMYSGTVGAVCEAVNLGVKALAFSTSPAYYMEAHKHLDRIFAFVQDNQLLNVNDFYNINIPADPGKIVITHQGGPYYSDAFTLENGIVHPHGIDVFAPCADDTVDTDCVLRCGNISIMPLTNQQTEMAVYHKLAAQLNK
ncbi:MAG: 5'/3'-nucleotidase SurE [Oscillospiraceae bacterium]|nr:5'/3'-nucleotidase SurE [Oscillospiraceae bacterium]